MSEAVLRILEHPDRTPGIYHLVNEVKCSWHDFTETIYDILGLTVKLKTVDRSGKQGDIRLPLYSALANAKARALDIVLPPGGTRWRVSSG